MNDLQLSVLVFVCFISTVGFAYCAYAIATLQKQIEDMRKDVLKLRRWYHD